MFGRVVELCGGEAQLPSVAEMNKEHILCNIRANRKVDFIRKSESRGNAHVNYHKIRVKNCTCMQGVGGRGLGKIEETY